VIVIPPLTILDAMLTSSTAAEPHDPAAYAGGTTYAFGDIVKVAADFTIYESLASSNTGHTPNVSPTWWKVLGPTETAYNSGTTYALGDTVSSVTTHRVYESLAASNVGNPLPVLPETATTKWLDVGPNNRWGMFDFLRNTKTVVASPLTLVMVPGIRIKAIALLGLEAISATVEMTLPTAPYTVHYTHTEQLQIREYAVADWYEYFFADFGNRKSLLLTDLPLYAQDVLTVTITNTAGPAACGAMVIGSHQDIGTTEYNAESDAINFSVVERDAFGNASMTQRRSVPKVNQNVLASAAGLRDIFNLRTNLNAIPAVWASVEDDADNYFDPFCILGFYRKFTITAMPPNNAMLALEIEEI
jgi:hypothetical protein